METLQTLQSLQTFQGAHTWPLPDVTLGRSPEMLYSDVDVTRRGVLHPPRLTTHLCLRIFPGFVAVFSLRYRRTDVTNVAGTIT